MKKYLEIAKIVSTHGIRGEVRCQYYCDAPEVLCEFDSLYLGKDKTPVTVERAFVQKNVVVLRLKGITSVEQAQPLIGKLLFIDREDAELPEDTYFIQDIIGLTVRDFDSGKVYGKITDIYQNGASDVYSMKQPDGSELMFPCIDEVVKKIDVDGGEILITPLPGLFEDIEEIGDNDEN